MIARFIFLLIALFIFCLGILFHTQHLDFWNTFWCDMLVYPAGILAGFSITLALIIFGFKAIHLFELSQLKRRIILFSGWLCVLSAIGILFPGQHDLYLKISGTFGLFSLLAYVTSIPPQKGSVFFWAGLLVWISNTTNFLLWWLDPYLQFLPILQKIATVFFLVWLLYGAHLIKCYKTD